jgi:hypothetical protein
MGSAGEAKGPKEFMTAKGMDSGREQGSFRKKECRFETD